MANIKDLKKYVGYEFSSGCYTGDDYKSFQTKYINFLKTMCRNNHWQLVNVGRNHYCFSAFIYKDKVVITFNFTDQHITKKRLPDSIEEVERTAK